MDNNYINNIMGSPYVNEGAFSRLKTKAVQGMRNWGAMMGNELESKHITQISSLWKTFISGLTIVLNDWEKHGHHLLTTKAGRGITITPSHVNIMNALEDLYSQVISYPKKNTVDNTATSNPTPTSTSTTVPASTPVTSSTTPIPFKPWTADSYAWSIDNDVKENYTELLKEGLWDAIKRGIDLNKAITSHDPSQIINAYKNKIIELYDEFIKDASKMTGISPNNIINVASKIPLKGPSDPLQNIKRITSRIPKLKAIADVPSSKIQGDTTDANVAPPISTTSAAPIPFNPPPLPTTSSNSPTLPSAPISSSNPPPLPTTSSTSSTMDNASTTTSGIEFYSDESGPMGGDSEAEKELVKNAAVVNAAIDIIIDTIKKDSARSQPFIGDAQKPLPQSWDDPSITETIVSAHSSIIEITTPANPSSLENPDVQDEIQGAFLYNFHSAYRKSPGKPFSIPMGNKNISNIGNVRVFWRNEGGMNYVFVGVKNPSKNINVKALLFRFPDADVEPRAGALKTFSVESIMRLANTMGEYPLEHSKDTASLNAIKSKTENLFRAFYAIKSRKSMEFKAKLRGSIDITHVSPNGDIDIKKDTTDNSKPSSFTMEQVKVFLTTGTQKSRNLWKNSLDVVDYFDKFPDLDPTPIEEHPKFKKAVTILMQSNIEQHSAESLVNDAWSNLLKNGKNPKDNTITIEDIVKLALPGVKSTTASTETPLIPIVGNAPVSSIVKAINKLGQNPNFKDAINILITSQKINKKDAIKLVYVVWENLKKDGKDPSKLTSKELSDAAIDLSKKPTTPTIKMENEPLFKDTVKLFTDQNVPSNEAIEMVTIAWNELLKTGRSLEEIRTTVTPKQLAGAAHALAIEKATELEKGKSKVVTPKGKSQVINPKGKSKTSQIINPNVVAPAAIDLKKKELSKNKPKSQVIKPKNKTWSDYSIEERINPFQKSNFLQY